MKKSLTIDGKKIQFSDGQTILDVAKENNIYIPTLCYIDGISPYGGCRLCIVKVEGMKGFPTACSTPALENMRIVTKDEELQDLRREILQLILIEHPNSCLVCDNKENCEDCRHVRNKSGRVFGCFSCPNKENCQLREIYNYLEIKDTHYELQYKYLPLEREDPFFERDYNLCILCGKCVRICNELRGIGAIQFINRGCETRVSSVYNLPHIDTNCQFCGACVDICPTGALSEKNMKFTSREKYYTSSICGFCSIGCGFNYSDMDGIVVESIPDGNNDVNKGQGCVIGRFCTASFNNGADRLKYPLLRKDNFLIPVNWDEIYYTIYKNLTKYKPNEIGFFISPELSCEAAYILNLLCENTFQSDNLYINGGNNIQMFQKLINTHLNIRKLPRSFDKIVNSSWILLINANIQVSHPVLMIKLHEAKKEGKKIIAINLNGSKIDNVTKKFLDYELNLSEKELNDFLLALIRNLIRLNELELQNLKNLSELKAFLELEINNNIIKKGQVDEIINLLAKDANGTILIGNSEQLSENSWKNIYGSIINYMILSKSILNFIPLWHGSNLEGVCAQLSNQIKTQNDLVKDIRSGKIKALFLTERIDDPELLKDLEFVVLQDIYPSSVIEYANLVLPSSTFLEDSGTFLNAELKTQKFNKCVPKLGLAKSDWQIFCDLGSNFEQEESNIFIFKNQNDILDRMKEQNQIYKKISLEELKNSLNKATLFLPSSKIASIKKGLDIFSLNSFKYRGEKIINKVPDLEELSKYKSIDKKFQKPQELKLKITSNDFKVLSKIEIVPNMHELIVHAPLIASKAQPGNFIILMKD